MREGLLSFYNRNWRWFVLGTLFLATFLNYFDRQTLGTAIEPISKEFGLDNASRGNLLAAFTLTYALTHFFIGIYVDRVKSIRIFFPIMVFGWSVSTLITGFVDSYKHILFLRYLLGFWEAVNFPLCLLIISRIFPANERSLASGIFASGAFLATLAAPPFVIYFANNYDWRYSFIIAGSAGLLWIVPWLIIFREPGKYSSQWILKTSHLEGTGSGSKISEYLKDYISIIRQPGFWGIALIGIGIIPCLYFATQWFPTYFTQGLNHEYNQSLSFKLSIIYFMQDLGLWTGGLMVIWLARKRMSILQSRKIVITIAYLFMMSVLLIPLFRSVTLSVVILSMFVFGIGAFLGNQHAFKQDVLKTKVATVSALVGFIETGFTFLVLRRIGMITNQTHDFSGIFLILALMATFSLIIVYVFIRPKWFKIE
jgi:ACS family hexuronate transporter-like MFS transporter